MLSPRRCVLATTATMEPPPLSWSRRHCRGVAAIIVKPPPLSWSRCHRCGAAAIVVESPPSLLSLLRWVLATTATMVPQYLSWSCRRRRGAVTIVVIDTPLPSLLSCRHWHGAAVVIVEPSLLSGSHCHCKTKKKKTKTKKKKKKTKKKKKKQSLRSHYNMLNEFATSAQSLCRQGVCCPKTPTRHQPHPTSTSADIASNKRYRKPD